MIAEDDPHLDSVGDEDGDAGVLRTFIAAYVAESGTAEPVEGIRIRIDRVVLDGIPFDVGMIVDVRVIAEGLVDIKDEGCYLLSRERFGSAEAFERIAVVAALDVLDREGPAMVLSLRFSSLMRPRALRMNIDARS